MIDCEPRQSSKVSLVHKFFATDQGRVYQRTIVLQ